MDVQRAQEIADSPVMVNVTYNGDLVYIEHVDREKQIAKIHSLNNPNNKQMVFVSDLQEQ
ncbi:MAG TPA: small acid-soluble spore protein H [Firmicutes bacterium]|jgi:small acid-soluble spore protein H (minor)|nr:small acid-soluble spore protein H [Bacillota bacterium]